MSATTGFSQFASLAAVQQPGSSPGPIRRTILLNMSSGGIENFSGNQAAGLGVVLEAGISGFNGTTSGASSSLTITNTWNTDTTLALYAGSVRFTNNATNNIAATAWTVSTL